MDEQINEMKSMIKKAVAAGMKRYKDGRFAKKQAAAKEGNVKMRAMFDPKSSYKRSAKMDLQKGRAARADVNIKKAMMAGKV